MWGSCRHSSETVGNLPHSAEEFDHLPAPCATCQYEVTGLEPHLQMDQRAAFKFRHSAVNLHNLLSPTRSFPTPREFSARQCQETGIAVGGYPPTAGLGLILYVPNKKKASYCNGVKKWRRAPLSVLSIKCGYGGKYPPTAGIGLS